MSQNLYIIDGNNRLKFHIEALDRNQCIVAHDTCKAEASKQRYTVIADILGSTIVAAIVVIAALATANAAAPYFLALVAKTESLSGFVFHPAVYDIATIAFYSAIYAGGLIGLRAIWENAVQKVQDHFAYAADLDKQALAANLRRAALDSRTAGMSTS